MSHKPYQWNVICLSCNQTKTNDQFYIHSNGKVRKQCKLCVLTRRKPIDKQVRNKIAAKYRETHREVQRQRCMEWRKNNLAYDAFRSATYRAQKVTGTPAWANIEAIKNFYLNCPKGYHVDHIIPLRGQLVSGLHVETNLQYLPAIENIKKKNIYHV